MQAQQVPTYALSVSTRSDRAGALALDGATLSGNVYVFTSLTSQLTNYDLVGITQVSYWLDNTAMAGAPTHTEKYMPYDLAGSASNNQSSLATPWDTTKVANGTHMITQRVSESNGATEVDTATFTIGTTTGGGAGQLTANPTSLNFGTVLVGSSNTLLVSASNSGTATAIISQANTT